MPYAMTHNLIIVGSGPAGYTAGIYTSRAKLEPLLFAGEFSGGQLMNTTMVENWPGSKAGIMGPELMMEMREQAEKFGTEIIDKRVTKVDLQGEIKKIWVGDPSTSSGQEYHAKAVIISTGAQAKMTGVAGEQEFLGRGVATCAVCDAAFYKDRITYVVGGGDAAVEDALALTKFASKVTMLVRSDSMKASQIMQDRAREHDKIEIKFNTQVKQIKGDKQVEQVVLVNSETDQTETLPADGVFVAIGHKPATELFVDQLDLDDKGYLLTNLTSQEKVAAYDNWLNQFPTMTSTKGVFAAGDVVDFRYRQAVTSAGMGCMAALDAEKYLTGHQASW